MPTTCSPIPARGRISSRLGCRIPILEPFANCFPPIAEALSLIHDLGGVSSWAHPRTEDAKNWLALFKSKGLKGVEAFRPSRGHRSRRKLRELAAHLQLHVTGGSDTHGNRRTTTYANNCRTKEHYVLYVQRMQNTANTCAIGPNGIHTVVSSACLRVHAQHNPRCKVGRHTAPT